MSVKPALPADLVATVEAARAKQAVDVQVLAVRELVSFADYFVIMSGTSVRQVQAIVEEIETRLKELGRRKLHREGFSQGDWVLLDFGDLVIHVFSPQRREFYDLERLWRDAERIEIPEAAA